MGLAEVAFRLQKRNPQFTTRSNAHLGRLAEARVELGRMLAIQPGATIARGRESSARAASLEFLHVIAEGLRRAGLPEA